MNSNDKLPRLELIEVLEKYLADLERGNGTDRQAILAAHPELAGELDAYLDQVCLLHGAADTIRGAKSDADGNAMPGPASEGRQLGDYQIVREIGRGGMGVVYEAHQKSLNRQVALKILPFAALLDQRQIARFRNEAQAAAQLHHPNIVPVFAVGQEQGVYYYAMQYIEGQSLEQAIGEMGQIHADSVLADRAKRSTKVDGSPCGTTTVVGFTSAPVSLHKSHRHAEFFRTVAQLGQQAALALQHAHDYGIIHRDVKPSNLLIDLQGNLWVTDFGLARTQTESGVTLTGDVVGTLRYMSPEQAAGRSALVDARTDVYSLGVTLYELLTGKPAHGGDDRQSLLRQVVNDEPAPLRRVNPAVPVDLETIVLAAMSKMREDRYATARALADDLDCFLAGKPTQARRPAFVDRAAKWARRHKPLVSVVGAALAMLTIVSAIGVALLAREQARTSAALVKAENSANAAEANLLVAQRRFQQARSAVDQLGAQLADRLSSLPGAESVRRDLLLQTLDYYRQFVAEAANNPQLRRELAMAHFKSGVITAKLGATSDAIGQYAAAQMLLEQLIADDSQPANCSPAAAVQDLQSHLALTHNNVGLLLASRGDTKTARQHYQTAIELLRRLVQQAPSKASYAGRLAETQGNFGLLLDEIGETALAERELRGAVDVLGRLHDSNLEDLSTARNLAIAYNNLSFMLRNSDTVEAEQTVRQAIGILQPLAEKYSAQPNYQDDLALCYNNLAEIESRRQQFPAAVQGHLRAIELEERLTRLEPGVVRHRSDLATSLNNLAVVYCRLDRQSEADAAFGRARELLSTLADDYVSEPGYRSSLAALMNNQALAISQTGRTEQAIPIFAKAIEIEQACFDRQSDSVQVRQMLSKMYFNYRQALCDAGRFDEAAKAALTRRDLWQGNGQRLVGVAAELSHIRSAMLRAPSAAEASGDPKALEKRQQELETDVVETLWQAYDCGWPMSINLTTDERFSAYRKQRRFAELIYALQQETPISDKTDKTQSRADRTLTTAN